MGKKRKIGIGGLLAALVLMLSLSSCKGKFEVSFDTLGGITIDTASIEQGKEYELPTDVKREGYSFEGWYTNSSFTGEKVTKITVNESVTLYAKWVKIYTITLNADGGSLASTTITAKEGDLVKNVVEDYVPTKSNLKFGNWFYNNVEIADTLKVTKDMTLVARYKAQYTLNTYKQKLNSEEYEKTETKAYAYVGAKVEADTDVEGFSVVEKADSVDEITISATEANVLNVYLNRDQYTVTLRSNYPNGDVEVTKTFTVSYGEEKELVDSEFEIDGYYLAGYSYTPDGEVVYDAHYMDNRALNGEAIEVEKAKVSTNKNISLYAIWNKGYRDMFGGDDYIFVADDETVYLCRNGVYFEGEYYASSKEFIFYNDNENLEGKLFDDGTFAYLEPARDEYSASLYKVGKGLDNNTKIFFDLYNGITYTVVTDGVTSSSKGTYTIDENDRYIATFTEGDLAGKTLTLMLGKVTSNNSRVDAFQLRNDEEAELGMLVRGAIYNSNLTYYTGAYQVMLSGFGTLLMNTGDGTATYYYTLDSEAKLLTISNSNGQQLMTAKLITINGQNAYMPYDAALDKTFTAEDGSTLVLNGLGEAVYTKDNTTVSGYYTAKSSAFGGYIITFNKNGKNYTFLTKVEKETVIVPSTEEGVEDSENTVDKYVFTPKLEGYAEYYYKDANGTFYAPLIVINDEEEGKANVYGYTSAKVYQKVYSGEYVYDEETKLYTFVKEESFENEAATTPIDLSTIKSFVFNLDSTSTSYSVNYWLETTLTDDTTTDNTVLYTSGNDGKITLVAGLAIYSGKGMLVTGTYKTATNGITTITLSNGAIYVILDETEHTFKMLDHAPFNAYVVTEDGKSNQKLYIALDGLGNGTYTYYEKENEEEVKKTIVGKVSKTDKTTKQGLTIYKFEATEKTFEYIMIQTKSGAYVFPKNETYANEYQSNDGLIEIDGFGYYASYTNSNGEVYNGIYAFAEENVMQLFTSDGETFYFDIKANKSFTVRGKEYGTYILQDNQGVPGIYITLNGYGKAELFTTKKNDLGESERVVIDSNAAYRDVDGLYTITYKEAAEQKAYIGYLDVYKYEDTSYNVFIIDHSEAVNIFVNSKDWSILKLDAKGNASKTNSKGQTEEGTYKLITENLLYYVNDESTDANIFTYNIENKTIVEANFIARGYYTSDLKSLLFSQYGFAIFNNETRYYYTITENGDVLIYHQDATDTNANKYGFVEDNFGKFEDQKEYDSKTYYMNDGYAIKFSRVEATKNLYPVLVQSAQSEEEEDLYAPLESLTFTPSGSDTFSVSGSVIVNGTAYSCTVTRELNDADEYEFYVTLGAYRWDIRATFTGKNADGSTNSTYEVTRMRYINSYKPYAYMDNLYYMYMFYGSQVLSLYKNNLGLISICKEFDEAGKEVENYAMVEFYEGTKAFDLNGESLAIEKVAYEKQTNGLYHIVLNSTDGYKYHLYFLIQAHQQFGQYGYRLYAITREETLTFGEYKATVERMLVTDTSYAPGTFFSVTLFKNDEEITRDLFFKNNDGFYDFVSRTKDEQEKITSTTYYVINFIEDDTVTEEDVVKPYKELSVEVKSATTYYDADAKNYVDMVDNKAVVISLNGSRYLVKETTYDEATETYTLVISEKMKYTLKIVEGKAVFTLVEEVEE